MLIRLFKKEMNIDPLLLLADLAFLFCIVTNTLWAHDRLGQIGLVLFGLAVLGLIIKKRGFSIDRFFFGYGLFILWGLIGVLAGWACDRSQALAMVKTLIIDCGFLFLVLQYLKGRDSLKQPFMVYILATAITIGIVFALSGPRWKYYRLGQLAGINPNKLGDMLLLAWCGVAYLFFEAKMRWAVIPGVLIFAAIMLTGSRQAMLAFAVFSVVYVLWMDSKHIVRNLLVLVALAAAGFAAIYFIRPLYRNIGRRLISTIETVLGLTDNTETSISERQGFLDAAAALFRQRPFTGWGYDCFRFASGMDTYAHSNYYELLADGGLPALALFYGPVVSVMIRCFKKVKTNPAARLGVVLMLTLLTLGVASVSYYDRVDLLLIPFALFFLGTELPKKENS